jgi:hypothetical protein
MAYRVTAHSARPARRGPPPALSRNALIAGVSLASLALAAAGALLTGNNEFAVVSHADRHAIKVALVDPAAPVVVARDTRKSVNLPLEARVQAASAAPPAPIQFAAYDPITIVAKNAAPVIPLPAARPRIVAAIPLPPGRPQVAESVAPVVTAELAPEPAPDPAPRKVTLAYAGDDITGSIGGPTTDIPRNPSGAPDAIAIATAMKPDLTLNLLPTLKHDTPAKSAAVKPAAAPKRPLTTQEKLWGGPVRLASLTPADAVRGGVDSNAGLPRAPYDRQTAVYVISERKVYLPDGSALEAHSGYRDKMDDPRFVHVRMRGATPPHVYELTMRERLFHGVEAIRLNPIEGEDAIFGRAGLLAHTYMLGPNGQSNGCVSFKDYETFLDAFKAGKINRLAVIARLD